MKSLSSASVVITHIFSWTYKLILSCLDAKHIQIYLQLSSSSKRCFFALFATVMSAVHTNTVKAYQVLTEFISKFCNCFQIHCNVFFSCSAIFH